MVRALDEGTDADELGSRAIEPNAAKSGELEPLDGQQRMSAIMLSFGQGLQSPPIHQALNTSPYEGIRIDGLTCEDFNGSIHL